MSNDAVKHDGNKPMITLLSPFALEEMAKVFYAQNNSNLFD